MECDTDVMNQPRHPNAEEITQLNDVPCLMSFSTNTPSTKRHSTTDTPVRASSVGTDNAPDGSQETKDRSLESNTKSAHTGAMDVDEATIPVEQV